MTMTQVTSAWRIPDFRRVWGAGAASSLGAEVGELAIPALAIVTLGASATEYSLVRAALLVPYLLLTLWLGVLVDRTRRRPLMIAADLGRGVLLVAVCGLALAGLLTVPMLVAAAALVGTLTVLYTLADFSFLPAVVDDGSLIDANARITATQSVIGIAGSGAGGLLVQAVTAPLALGINALGYLTSAALISRVSAAETPPPAALRRSVLADARLGLVVLFRHRVLRPLVAEASIWNLGNEVLTVALSVLLLRDHGYGPAILGLVLMGLGAGAFVGSVASARLTARFGYGRSLIVALIVGNTAPLVGMLTAGGSGWGGLLGIGAAFVVSGFGIGVANSQAVSLRQLATAPDQRGRVNAAYRLISWGALSCGALAGGALATALGAWPAAVIGAAVMATATVPVILSPVRGARTLSAAADAR